MEGMLYQKTQFYKVCLLEINFLSKIPHLRHSIVHYKISKHHVLFVHKASLFKMGSAQKEEVGAPWRRYSIFKIIAMQAVPYKHTHKLILIQI